MNREEAHLDQCTQEHLSQAISYLDSDEWLQLFHQPDPSGINNLRIAVSTVIDAINQFAEDNNVPCKPSDRCGCGGKAILTDYMVEGALKQYSVACETCFIGLPYGFDTPDDAWAAWRRAMGTPSGAIVPDVGEMAPNGDEGAEQ